MAARLAGIARQHRSLPHRGASRLARWPAGEQRCSQTRKDRSRHGLGNSGGRARVGNRHRGALYVVRGDLRRIQADAYLLPTDSFGRVTGTWAWLIGRDGGRCRQLICVTPEVLSARSGVWLDGAMGGRTALAADVGGYEIENSVRGTHSAPPFGTNGAGHSTGVVGRGLRARRLLAMPLVGVEGGGLGQDTGQVIAEVLRVGRRVSDAPPRDAERFDIVLVCRRQTATYAAVSTIASGANPALARTGLGRSPITLAVGVSLCFSALGASAGLGLPDWKTSLAVATRGRRRTAELVDAGLSELDLIVDAATILVDALARDPISAIHCEIIADGSVLITNGSICQLRPALAITTNYDEGDEHAIRARTGMQVTLLPWDEVGSVEDGSTGSSPKVLKLHGDVRKGQDRSVPQPVCGDGMDSSMPAHWHAAGTHDGSRSRPHGG